MVKHKLKVTLLIDQNGWQGFGRTFDLDAAPDLAPKLSVFGLDVSRCPGHDLAVLEEMLSPRPQGPRAVVLDTVKGRGLPFFEDRLESHYLPMTKEQYQQVNSAGSAEAERRP
jgi:Transketolase, N-terminal subunit